jgi:hypothetical protein
MQIFDVLQAHLCKNTHVHEFISAWISDCLLNRIIFVVEHMSMLFIASHRAAALPLRNSSQKLPFKSLISFNIRFLSSTCHKIWNYSCEDTHGTNLCFDLPRQICFQLRWLKLSGWSSLELRHCFQRRSLAFFSIRRFGIDYVR